MRLFLIRHGETVDNVAGRYAGSRDSALTAHGVLQARRLASHLAQRAEAKHAFSSDLKRAAKTAEAVIGAQPRKIALTQLPELREKDFGSSEGAKYGMGKTNDGETRREDDSETPVAMTARTDRFLDQHLLPVLRSDTEADSSCVVVAHGIILGVLFKSLCARIRDGAMTASPDAQTTGFVAGDSVPVLPMWSNTGYLECSISGLLSIESTWPSAKLHVKCVNCVEHLRGLKKTRGGIGSAEFDAKQRTMDTFFTATGKKRKHDDTA